MGTKNNPGRFDCHAKAEPDEPVFVLLGRDPVASVVVHVWASLRERLDDEDPKCDEAMACASAMAEWAESKGKVDEVKLARAAYRAELEEVHLTRVSGEVDRLSERVRELEKERDEDRDRYDTTVGHVRVLEALCRRAADAVKLLCLIKSEVQSLTGTIGPIVTAVESVDGEELAQLVKELREADPRARIEEGRRLLKLEALCRRAAKALDATVGNAAWDGLIEELRAV